MKREKQNTGHLTVSIRHFPNSITEVGSCSLAPDFRGTEMGSSYIVCHLWSEAAPSIGTDTRLCSFTAQHHFQACTSALWAVFHGPGHRLSLDSCLRQQWHSCADQTGATQKEKVTPLNPQKIRDVTVLLTWLLAPSKLKLLNCICNVPVITVPAQSAGKPSSGFPE